jgi:hypothetical protein
VKSIGGLVTAVLLVTSLSMLSACGDSSPSAGPADGETSAHGVEASTYCSLVSFAKDDAIPKAPAMDPQHLDVAAMRRWFDDAVATLPATTDKIIDAAPAAVVADWKAIRKVQQGLVDGLGEFLKPANIASWQKLPLQQRAVAFARQVIQPMTGLPKAVPGRINAEVLKDCGTDLGMS